MTRALKKATKRMMSVVRLSNKPKQRQEIHTVSDGSMRPANPLAVEGEHDAVVFVFVARRRHLRGVLERGPG